MRATVPLAILLLIPPQPLPASDPCERTDVIRSPVTLAPYTCGMQGGLPWGYLTLRCDRRGSPLPVAISAGSAFVDEAGLWVGIVVENRSRRTIRVPRRNGAERY